MTGWPDRRFLELVGTEHPIVQAPMANAGGVDLCVGAMQGGALGSLPCGMLSAEEARQQAQQVRERSSGPINLNFLCHGKPRDTDDSAWRALLKPYYDEFGVEVAAGPPARVPFDEAACAMVEELRPEVVSFHFGIPDAPLFERVKRTGAAVIATATTVQEAKHLQDAGVDAIIAQGFEAGGHSGRFLASDPAEAMGLFALLPQIVDEVSLPVIAAGGISDGRGLAAAFMLGASAVQLGTAYLHCPESLLAAEQRRLLKEGATVMTNLYSGGLARAVRGRLVNELGPVRGEAPPYPLAGAVTMPLFRAAIQKGDYGLLPSLGGQGSRQGRDLPAAKLTRQLAREATALLNGSGAI